MTTTQQRSAPAEPTAAIPYRTSSEVSGGDIAGAFAAAVTLLAMAIAVAWLARRLGWLQRWGVRPTPAAVLTSGLRIEQALRISPRTMLFRIADGDQRFLLAESREGLQMLPLPPAKARTEPRDAS